VPSWDGLKVGHGWERYSVSDLLACQDVCVRDKAVWRAQIPTTYIKANRFWIELKWS
jgi:hypothetical protein